MLEFLYFPSWKVSYMREGLLYSLLNVQFLEKYLAHNRPSITMPSSSQFAQEFLCFGRENSTSCQPTSGNPRQVATRLSIGRCWVKERKEGAQGRREAGKKKRGRGREQSINILLLHMRKAKEIFLTLFSGDAWIKLNMLFIAIRSSYSWFWCFIAP